MAEKKVEEKKEMEPWKILDMKNNNLETLVSGRMKEFEGANRKAGRLVTANDLLTCSDAFNAFMYQCKKGKNVMTSIIALGILDLLEEMREIKTLLSIKEDNEKPTTKRLKKE